MKPSHAAELCAIRFCELTSIDIASYEATYIEVIIRESIGLPGDHHLSDQILLSLEKNAQRFLVSIVESKKLAKHRERASARTAA